MVTPRPAGVVFRLEWDDTEVRVERMSTITRENGTKVKVLPVTIINNYNTSAAHEATMRLTRRHIRDFQALFTYLLESGDID